MQYMADEIDELLEGLRSGQGIDQDYWNEYAGLWLNYQLGGVEAVAEALRKRPVKMYWENHRIKRMVGTERGIVETLTEIARYVNENFTDPTSFGKRELQEVFDETHMLVYGTRFRHSLC